MTTKAQHGGGWQVVLPRTKDGEQCNWAKDQCLVSGRNAILHAIQKSASLAEAANDDDEDVVDLTLIYDCMWILSNPTSVLLMVDAHG